MQDRQSKAAAIGNDPAPAQPGTYQRGFQRGLGVEPLQEPDPRNHRNDNDNNRCGPDQDSPSSPKVMILPKVQNRLPETVEEFIFLFKFFI